MRAFALALLCLLAACASRPRNVLHPIGQAPPDARVVSMLVVSTRETSEVPGEVYSGRRAMKPSLALIDVSIPPTHRIGRIEWPREAIADPQTEFATVGVATADDDAVEAWFNAQNAEGHVVIFVHGFNVPFDGAVYRLAQLIADADPMAAPILFTWPSLGSAFAYVYDRESAAYSRDALEDLLRTAVENPRVTSITILAHSMGTWLAMETLRQYAMRSGRIDPKINNVILASPDLDADVFRMQFLSLGDERPEFTFLIARDDRALLISRLLAAGVTRVGSADITREPYRSVLAQVEGVTVVDMTGLREADRANHLLFAESPQAVRLLSSMFMMGQANDPYSQVGLPTSMGAMVIILAQGAVTMVDPPEAPASAAPEPAQPVGSPEPND